MLAGGIVLGLFPTLALAADVASAPSDPAAAGTSTSPDPAATGGASTDPAQPAATGTEPTATGDPAAGTAPTNGSDPAAGTTDPTGTTGDTSAPPAADPSAGTTPSPPVVSASGPVACSSATAEAAAAGCPTLVLEQAQPAPAPAPEQPPAQTAPPPAPAPAQAPPPAEPVVPPALITHVPPAGEAAPGPLAPLHGTLSPTDRPAPVAPAVRPAAQDHEAPAAAAPVLTQQAAPLLVPHLKRLAVAAPRADSVVLRPFALRNDQRGAGAPSLQDSLPPLLKSVAAPVEPPAEEHSIGLGSTGGDEPLPLPPRDPSESPTGLGAPSSGGGLHGSTGVFAILTALVLLFVPRMVRRLPRVGAVAPRIGYRLVLERPG
ncbi:MAG TPA: hypothetical protein VFR43_09660 [Gaiellaceae bacterium]|nr:hypothetical protein [Gaiellaceae bacterium]